MSTNTTFTEKRSLTRFPVNTPATIKVKGNNRIMHGTCHNISGSGMLISTGRQIPTETEIRVEIHQGKIDFSSDARMVRLVDNGSEILMGIEMQSDNPV